MDDIVKRDLAAQRPDQWHKWFQAGLEPLLDAIGEIVAGMQDED